MSNQIDKQEKLFSIEDLERVIESFREESFRSDHILTRTCFLIAECHLGILIQSKAPGSLSEPLKPST